LALLLLGRVVAAEHSGQVMFRGLPVPGATVTATQDDTKFVAVTDARGTYSFDLPDGTWTVEVEMLGFAPAKKDVAVAVSAASVEWELNMLPLDEMRAQAMRPPAPAATKTDMPATPGEAFADLDPAELTQRAADGFLINGTANNAAASPFSQPQAFGNNRRSGRALYNGNLGVILGNSALDARPFSLTGQNTPRPDYNRMQGVMSFGGPLRIPGLLRNGPNLMLDYQWIRKRNVSTSSGLMPTEAERNGDLSQLVSEVLDPASGLPFPGKIIPRSRISPQAEALLALYPLPNFESSAGYNYQVPIVGDTHQDNLQSRFNQRLPRRNRLFGNFAFQSTRTDSPNLFGFLDKTNSLGLNSGVNWLHMFSPRLYTIAGYQFSRLATRITPFFSNRQNVSGDAGIFGNNQDPVNWGPPSLQFASGIAGLSDAQYSSTRNQTSAVSLETRWSLRSHNLTFGGDFRRHQFNLLAQEDPRGTFAFTGASGTGSDFAGFLLGIPDTSSIGFGNADKYLRAPSADAYISDDWRVRPGLNAEHRAAVGVRRAAHGILRPACEPGHCAWLCGRRAGGGSRLANAADSSRSQ
jgi:hypothetical protein